MLALGASQAEAAGTRRFAVTITGRTVTLAFHGDEATGCAQRGLCDTSGTVTVTRPARSKAGAFMFAAGRSILGPIDALGQVAVAATVHDGGAPDCSDAETSISDSFMAASFGGPLLVGYGTTSLSQSSGNSSVNFGSSNSGDVFATRCAGPLPDDYAPALPLARVKRADLRRRTFRADLSGTKSFAGGGFAGTVTSNLVLTFRRLPCPGKAARRSCRKFDHSLR